MISMDFKSQLAFYIYTEEVHKELKNWNTSQQKQKFEGLINQERYIKEILSVVKRRKGVLKTEGKKMII